MRGFCLLAALTCLTGRLEAHAPETSYLYLSILKERIYGRVEINIEDANKALGTDIPQGATDAQIAAYADRLHAYLEERVRLSAGGQRLTFEWTQINVLDLDEEEYDYDVIRVLFNLPGAGSTITDKIQIDYEVLFDREITHNGVLIINQNWKAGIIANETRFSATFQRGNTSTTLDLTSGGVWTGFVAMVRLGMHHIFIGLDHVLFIIALILPSVVRRKKHVYPQTVTDRKDGNRWVPVGSFKEAFWAILKVVTSFTLAHSITLSLASLGILELPSRPVETIIAFSIALAALHNIYPLWKAREWIIAFVFGLFHGFGFAGVLGEKGLSGDYMAYTLLGFNVGVEIGQVLIICAIFPLLFLLRKWKGYDRFVFWGSIALILVSTQWVIERALDYNIRFFDLFKGLF